MAGQQFPIIHYEEREFESGNGASPVKAGVWTSGQSTVVFGNQPYRNQSYWQILGRAVHSDSDGMNDSKLAVIRGKDEQLDFGPSVGEDRIDIVDLDADALRKVNAASEILAQAERGELEVPVPSALESIVEELDFFWRRVSQPATRSATTG